MGTEKGVNSEADDCWKGIFRFPVVRNAAVVSGIFLLNLPAVVSRWQPEANSNALYSILSHLKRFPVFSLSTKFLDSHISLSVDNINEGRYYTAVTTLFNHSGEYEIHWNATQFLRRRCAGIRMDIKPHLEN